jgi:hypothetical protein
MQRLAMPVVGERIGLKDEPEPSVDQVRAHGESHIQGDLRLYVQTGHVDRDGAQHGLEGVVGATVGRLDDTACPGAPRSGKLHPLQVRCLHEAFPQGGVGDGEGLVEGKVSGAVNHHTQRRGDTTGDFVTAQVSPADVKAPPLLRFDAPLPRDDDSRTFGRALLPHAPVPGRAGV